MENELLLQALSDMIDQKIAPIKTDLEQMMDEKLAPMESKLEQMIDKKFAPMESKLEQMMDEKLAPINSNLEQLNSEMSALKSGQIDMRMAIRKIDGKVSDTYDLALEAWGKSIENRTWLEDSKLPIA